MPANGESPGLSCWSGVPDELIFVCACVRVCVVSEADFSFFVSGFLEDVLARFRPRGVYKHVCVRETRGLDMLLCYTAVSGQRRAPPAFSFYRPTRTDVPFGPTDDRSFDGSVVLLQ